MVRGGRAGRLPVERKEKYVVMRQSILHPEVVLRLPRPHLPYSVAAQAMITAVDGNANFPNAATQVAAAKAALTPYLDAIAARARHEAGAVKARNDARRVLQQALEHLRDAVQYAVDADVEQAESLAIVRRASRHTCVHTMGSSRVGGAGRRPKPPRGSTSAEVSQGEVPSGSYPLP
jgi:hypothetical protein